MLKTSPFHNILRFVAVILLAALVCSSSQHETVGQSVTSGFEQTGWLLKGATVISKPGAKPVVADVLIVGDLIQSIGPEIKPPPGVKSLDLTGFYLYAGLIDARCRSLLPTEIKFPKPEERKAEFERYALAATREDHRHQLSPELMASEILVRDEKHLKKLTSHGFTIAHVVPQGRVSSGQSTIIALRDAPLREVQLTESAGLTFRLFAPGGSIYPATLMGTTAHLRQAVSDARRYALHQKLYAAGERVSRPADDVTWELLNQVDRSELPALWQTDSRDDILRTIQFHQKHKLPGKPILMGVSDAWKTVEELKEAEATLIVSLDYGDEPKIEIDENAEEFQAELKDPLTVQQEKLDHWKERVELFSRLNKDGISWAVGSTGLDDPDKLLPAMRTAVKHGLSTDEALAALTTSPAEILDLPRLGKIEPGFLSHLVVANGPLFVAQTKIARVFVDGRQQEIETELKPWKSEDANGSSSSQKIAGTWNFLLQNDSAETAASIEFTQDGSKLNGLFRSEQGDGRLDSGKIDAEKVSWNVVIGAGARELILKFSGTVKEDDMSGTLTPPFGKPSDWTAKRKPVEPSATEKNPVQLTLEIPADDPADSTALPTETHADRIRMQRDLKGNLLITHATIMTGTGDVLEDASILIRDGKIAGIGKELNADEGMTVIDASGKCIIPGIIDTHSHIMISGGVNESTLSIVPEVSIEDVVRTDDLAEYRALAGGVTTARLLHGSANVIGGQDGVVKLKFGKSAEEHLLQDNPQGVKFALGENVKANTSRFPNTRLGVEATLERAFLEAIDYRRRWMGFEKLRKDSENPDSLLPPRRDYRLEALADIVNHEKFIHSHCYRADEILMLLRVASDLGIRVWSLQHVLEGYKIAPEIKEHGASCSTFADWWAYKVEAYDAIPQNAALLNEAGINSVIKSDDAELIRHMTKEAAKTIRYGNMPEAAALQAITRNSARELGIEDRIGTLEVGKDGDLAIFNAHPFHAFARCDMTVIEGDIYFDRAQASTAVLPEVDEKAEPLTPIKILSAEERPAPLDLLSSESGKYVLLNAHLHPVSGPDIAKGTLIIEDGKITALGAEVDYQEVGAKVIDLNGLHVYPGLIDAGTTLGLTEIGRVKETSDYSESGDFQADLRAGVGINPDSELIPVSRAGGITTILAQPKSGLISGQASLIKLHGWTTPQMTIDLEAALRINWPRGENEKKIESLNDFFAEAEVYRDAKVTALKKEQAILKDPRYEAMLPYLAGEKPVLIEAHARKEIVEAVTFAEEHQLKLILGGAGDAWKVAEELRKRDIPVILGPVMERPLESWDPYDAPYANAGRLHAAGVRFCIRSDDASNSRNAPFEAARAVAFGLPSEIGLRAVTLSAAEILGLDQELGSLDVGKRATLIVTDGSPLQHTAQIHGVFIDGQPYRPESRQTKFYERYRQRLQPTVEEAVSDIVVQ
jgi:imidazolonepropionase-like amidohydrolase